MAPRGGRAACEKGPTLADSVPGAGRDELTVFGDKNRATGWVRGSVFIKLGRVFTFGRL
jgi:hypothetical protein